MKNILSLALILLSLQFVHAQGPGGVSLSSNNLWVSADYGLTLDASNGVEIWENRMGIANLNMLGIGANKPTYVASDINGLPTISFDGTVLLESSGYLGSSYFPTSDASVFIVTSNNDLGNASVIYGTYPLSTTRFASHLSWSNSRYYFDIGVCCTPRVSGTYASVGATASAYYIWGYTANSSANLLSAYLDNLEINTNSQTGTFTDHSTKKFQLGGQGEDPYGFDGDVAEFILFNEAVNAAQRTVINNYLSSKYNLTITDDYYADATYTSDVIGIGTSDGALKHAASVNGSVGLGLAESNTTLNAANEYVFAGHDNTANAISISNLGTGVEERWEKDWSIEKTGTVDAQISFDFSEGINGLYPQNSDDYLLLRLNAGTYEDVGIVDGDKSISGDKIIFDVSDADLTTGYYTLGTADKTASPVFGKSLRKWYSYQSGNWADPLTWTLDGGGTPIYDNGSAEVPTADDIVIITSGRTVNIQSTTNNIDISEFQVVGQLNLTTSTGHTFNKISGNGIITTTAAIDNFPDGDASDFANTSIGGTFIVNGTGITLGTDREFNELQINLTSTSDIAIMASDYVVNGALTITNGIFQINDNSNTAQLNLTVEDLTVGANGKIAVGTASTIGTFLIAGTLPTVGNYHAIYHRINIYGDFTNDGTVKFTNQSVPDYNELYAGGAATVYFKGDGDNTTTLNGQTDFYNLVVDKGDDQSYVLEINSASAANFTLFGANSASWNSTSPYSTNNPEVRKALWIKNGTLKLTGTMLIPTLTEGANSDGEYLIADNGALWIASANVELRTTAITTDTEVTGHSGVTDGTTINESFALFGKLRIGDGIFSTNNSQGIVYVSTSFSEILIEAGTVNLDKLLALTSDATTSYTQSGGILTLSGTNTSGDFDLEGTGVIFNMSGGEIILDEGDFLVGATAGNYSVTGGKVTYNMSEGTVINSTANLWDLQLQSQTTDNRRLRLNNDLVVSNDLTIKAYARLDSDDNGGGIFDLTIGADFTIETGGSTTKYYANTNTTTIDGAKISNLNFADLVTFNNLTINKSDASQLIEIDNGAATAIQIDGAFRLEDGTLDHKSFVVNAKGSVYVSDTLGVAGETGKLLLDGAAQQSFTSLNGVIANIEIDNSNGIDLLSGDLSIFETLTMTTGVFDINTSKLTMAGASANITGTFSSTLMIQTAGNASDGGLEMYIDANETITFPIGTDANADTRYTPLVAEYSSYSDDGYVSVSPSDDVLATTNGGGGTMLSYYWHVVHQGFSTVPKVTSYTFSGSENDDGTGSGATFPGSWRAGKVLSEVPYTRSKEGAGGVNNPTGHDITFDGDATPFDVENADYSAGPSNRFNGSPGVYYSKETDTDGSLNFLPAWSSTSSWVHIDDLIDANGDGDIDELDYHDGRQPDAAAAPGVGDIAIIGFIPWTDDNITYRGAPHHISLWNTSASCAQLNFTQMEDVSGNPVARNEDRFWAMRPSVIIAVSGQLNADVVNGEGEFFMNYGGDQDFSVMDLGNFVSEDSSLVFYEADANQTYNNAPDEVPNLILGTNNWGANDFDISFSNDIDINVNLEILGNANLVLSSGATGDLTIDNDLIMFEAAGGVVIPGCCTSGASGGGAQIIYPNLSNARSITVTGDIEMNNAGGLIYVNSPGTTPLSHSLNVYGNITQNTAAGGNDGLLLWTASNSDVIDLNLLGDTSMTFDVTSGDIPELNRLIVNKGTDASTSATINTDFNLNSTTNGATKALELQNGTLILNDAAIDIDLTTGGDDFSIPGTSTLQVTQGTVNVSGDDSGIWLDGSLIIDGGTVDMDDTGGGNGNNYIEYSASGTATIDISAGILTVGSQIRRNTVATTGVLNYTQTGGAVIIGKNAAPESNRGVFEVLNTGSDMTFTGGNFTLVRQNGTSPTIAALYLAPESNDFTGSTITIGSADTPAAQTEFNITALAAFNNITFAGSNTPTSKLKVLGLLVGGDLTINSGHTLDGNAYNVTLGGDFTNNGTYTANGNVTYFTGAAGTQTYSGSGAETFYDFTKLNTSDLVVSKDLIIANDLTLTDGTFDTGTNEIIIQGNAEIDLDVSSTSGNGLVFQGASGQLLSRSASGASSIDILTIDNGLGVTIPSSAAYNFTINKNLRLSNGLFSIGSNLLTISEICSIEEVNTFTDGNMIHTNSSFTDNGVKKEFPTIGSSTNFTFPVGEAIYTPVVFTITSMDAGSITARPANEMHITIIEDTEAPDPEIVDADNALQYHWVMQASDILSMTGLATFTYDPTDAVVTAPYTLANYIPARLLDATTSWDKAFSSTNFDEGGGTFTIGFVGVDTDGIVGVYTAGVGVDNSDVGINGAIPDVIPTYETNSTGGGDYDAGATWTTSIPSGGPLGGQITVKNGDDLLLNNDGVRLSRTLIEAGGTLTVDETTFHRLGTVTGTGVLKIVSSTTNANLPAGYYGDFFSCTGGSIEYAGTGNYSIMPSLASVRSLILSGSGDRDLANNDVAICDDLTINGPTFNNANNRTLTITDELIITAGTFNSGTGTIDVDGDMTVNGGTFDNQTGGVVDIAGTLNISSGTFNAGSGGSVYLRGNVNYTGGTFTGGSSTASVRFNGATLQTVAGDFTGTNSFYRVDMNNGISLSNNIEIDNQLTFLNGVMDANANTVTLGSAITVSPAEGLSNSYIDGKVLKTMTNIGDNFTFPIGKNGRWGHASVKNVSIGGETWDAEYFFASPTTHADVDNITPIAPILTISNNEYWIITDGNVGSIGMTANIGLSWDGGSDVSPISGEREQLEVMIWNDGASTWDEYGGGTFSGSHTQSAGSFQSTSAISFSQNIITLGSTNLLNALPVELLSFEASTLGNTVKLIWETASELNNDYFTLLRSKDGEYFEEVTTVLGSGTSTELLEYSFVDERPYNGISYYKLLQTDFDGTTVDVGVVLAKMDNNSNELVLTAYPNPFSNEEFNLVLSGLNKEEPVSLAVFDIFGKQQYLTTQRADSFGYLDLIIDSARDWKPGIYIVRALTEKGAIQAKIMKR